MLIEDRHAGASLLLQRACAQVESCPPDQVIDLAHRLLAAQPTMAPIYQLASRILKGEEPRAIAREMKEISQSASEEIAEQMFKQTPREARILTHSSSWTVEQTLVRLRNPVVVGEGRPALEGRALAERLASQGIEVTLCTDSAEIEMLRDCDLVMVGADAVSESRFVNKVGTLALLLGARELGLPAYLLADGTKRVDEEFIDRIFPSDKPFDQIDGVVVANPQYERVPRSLLT